MLIAGSSGSGKSMFVHSILYNLIRVHSPKDLRLVLMDLEHIELNLYKKLPHLLIPVINSPAKILNPIRWLEEERERRENFFVKNNINDFEEYHSNGYTGFPHIVCVIEGFDSDPKIEGTLDRVSLHGGTFGIYFILTMQRPHTSIISRNLKADFGSRVSFSLSQEEDYKLILGQRVGSPLSSGELYYKSSIQKLIKLKRLHLDLNQIKLAISS